jgi:poly-gamma-glutamate synthesis protein (capsule biosynthesis protein)
MKIALMGDVMLGRLVNQVLKDKPSIYPWGNTVSILQQADLRICNLECVLSDIGIPWSYPPKVFHFRTDEKNMAVLQAANINLVSLANNHVLDFEYDALLRMLDVIDGIKIQHAGAGRNLSEASAPAICEIGNQKIGLLAFTDNEPAWEAKENIPGIYYVPVKIKDPRAQNLFKTVEELKQNLDYLIISAHWGPNWGYDPPREQIEFAHALIQAGANLIFGHSGHVFRGIEIYEKSPILYCTGDFVDDYAIDEIERNDESFIFMIEKSPNSNLKIELFPTYIDQFQANLAESEQKHSTLMKMHALCEDLGTKMQLLSKKGLIEVR